jgi:hypothetical protein
MHGGLDFPLSSTGMRAEPVVGSRVDKRQVQRENLGPMRGAQIEAV